MINTEAKELADKIYSDVIELGITSNKIQRLRIAKLIARSIQQRSNDAVWQYVINDLEER